MTTNLSPVMEAEMREFFERLISTVVGLSEQARELVQLRNDVGEASKRLTNLIEDQQEAQDEIKALRDSNAWLSRSAAENGELARVYSEERDSERRKSAAATEAFETLRQTTEDKDQRFHDTLQERDGHIQRLESDLSQANNTVAQFKKGNEWSEAQLKQAWAAHDKAQAEATLYKEKFNAFKSLFQDDDKPNPTPPKVVDHQF